nr:DUF4422 domain-containing protein [Brucella intermedia]
MNIEIYVAGHKASSGIPDETYIPIHVGKNGRKISFCAVGDDTGDNISGKNDTFCELTALYWMWKNTKNQEYIGLFHYRRHLNFSFVDTNENEWGVTEYDTLSEKYIETNQLTTIGAQTALKGYDIILPRKWDVRNAGSTSMYDHYKNGPEHHIRDYELALKILREKYPEYAPFVLKVNDSTSGYFTNIFVMKRDIFDKYCSWIFDILFELESRIDLSSYSVQERRIYGYISEWLFNIFIEKLIFDHPELKLKTVQRTFIVETAPKPSPIPAFAENNVPIVMAFNDDFASYAGTTILSILMNASRQKNYDFLIFDGGVSERNKELLNKTISSFENVSVRYLNPLPLFHSLNLPTHLHFSRDVYYRLYIPDVCSHYERVVYIDGDTIVRGDVSDLFEIDLNGKPLGAVQDCVMTNFRKLKVPSIPSTGSLEAEIYLKNYLGLKQPSGYFQSGVIVFDIKESQSALPIIKNILESGKTYWFPDQDILNIAYQDNVELIDERWNVFHGNGDIKTFYEKLPYDVRAKYFKSRENPLIIHYAGERKPWKHIDVDFSEDFWLIARHTAWYESMLFSYVKSHAHTHTHTNTITHVVNNERQAIGIRDVGRAIVNPFAPLGSKRRSLLRGCYHAIRRLTGN